MCVLSYYFQQQKRTSCFNPNVLQRYFNDAKGNRDGTNNLTEIHAQTCCQNIVKSGGTDEEIGSHCAFVLLKIKPRLTHGLQEKVCQNNCIAGECQTNTI
jgi:hypothetical protein